MSGIESSPENEGQKNNQKEFFPIFIDEQTGRVAGSRSARREVPKRSPDRESKLTEILDRLNNPEVPVAELNRLIAVEIALIIQHMQTFESDRSRAHETKSCMGQIRALQALGTKKVDWWAKHDVLDFDGPKFQFVFGKLVLYFQEAALKALRGDESTVQSIMKHYRDISAKHEEELRRETQKIDYRMDTPSSNLPSKEINQGRELLNVKNLQTSEPSPPVQLAGKLTTENSTPDNATARQDEQNDDSEPEDKQDKRSHYIDPENRPVPFKDLIKGPEDLITFYNVQDDIEREPPLDLEINPEDSAPPEAGDDL